MGPMASWNEVSEAAADLAGTVRARFEATGLGLLATLRRDGSPRISGIEPSFAAGELWLGMMDGSRKALDLQRDPRLALHSATADKDVKEGDARITGRGVEVLEGDERREAFLDHLRAKGDWAPDGPFHLFAVDVTELMMLRPGGDHLVIESWREGGEVRRVERR
jgi:pyridoxamine 5'-phosphate oxidase-like protein